MNTLDWPRRARIKTTEVGRFRRWQSADGLFAVVHVRSLLGLPSRWLAIRRGDVGNEAVIGRHKTRAAAERTCATAAKRERRTPKQKIVAALERKGLVSRVGTPMRITAAGCSTKQGRIQPTGIAQ